MESTLLQWYTFVEKWPKYTFLCPFINYLKLRIKNISPFPDTLNKKLFLSRQTRDQTLFLGAIDQMKVATRDKIPLAK